MEFIGATSDTSVDVRVDEPSVAEQLSRQESGKAVVNPPRWQRAPMCTGWGMTGEDPHGASIEFFGAVPTCSDAGAIEPGVECGDGEALQEPLWRSDPDENGTYGSWIRVSGYTCTADPLHAAAINAWDAMVITPSSYQLQPDTGWATTQDGFYAVPDTTPQVSTVNLAGTDVTLRATPVTWTWSDSDGDTHVEHRPNRGYESGAEPFTFTAGERRLQWNLTTTWSGTYSLDGGVTWVDAPGTATTTSEPRSIHLYSPRARLVDCDTYGRCTSGNAAPRGPVPTVTDPDADGIDNFTVPDDQISAYLARHNAD